MIRLSLAANISLDMILVRQILVYKEFYGAIFDNLMGEHEGYPELIFNLNSKKNHKSVLQANYDTKRESRFGFENNYFIYFRDEQNCKHNIVATERFIKSPSIFTFGDFVIEDLRLLSDNNDFPRIIAPHAWNIEILMTELENDELTLESVTEKIFWDYLSSPLYYDEY